MANKEKIIILEKDENIFLSIETAKYLCEQIIDGVMPSHFTDVEIYHANHYYQLINNNDGK